MPIISLVNKKGGVVKTTAALALASGGDYEIIGSFDILTGKENINCLDFHS